MRVLIVEDDDAVRHWIGAKLRNSGHECRLTVDGHAAVRMLDREAFDVVVLDRGLPRMDGLEVLRQIGGRRHPPVLILSANDAVSDRVEGLRAGADDYLGKPFDYDELLLRLENLASRHQGESQEDVLEIEDLRIDVTSRRVTRSGKRILLTNKEFLLLQALARRPGRTVPRGMLLEEVWGMSFAPQTNLIDVHMSNLRTKIDGGHARGLLRTIRSVGYVLG